MQARAYITRSVFTLMLLAPSLPAASVSKLLLARSVDESSCAAPHPVSRFDAGDREAFVWFRADRVRDGDSLEVQWLAPDGSIALDAPYRDVPQAASLCFASRLPIAGFTPASQPGNWTVRVMSEGRALASREFTITGQQDTLRVSSVRRDATASGMELTIDGAGFSDGAIVHIAQYTPSGGWRYISAAQPRLTMATRLVADHGALPAAEYLIIVRNGDGRVSRPAPFVIPTGGYKLPTVAGEPWIITQGPYGAFSHWGRTLHAYDIAPRSGRCIVAMRAGVVHVHDIGARQDHAHRTFGNYITIDHGDGEYSHYAHLATGSFVVREGQYVEQGQALAVVGNSGYTLGEGGGYHVHVQVTRSPSISSASVPFVFEDFSGPVRGAVIVVSSNASSKCDCHVRAPETEMASRAAPAVKGAAAPQPQFTGRLGFAQWWSEVISVPARSASFDAKLTWPEQNAGLDLHLMSPSGHHYAWYADPTGYSGPAPGSQSFHIPNPEPGTWRISVQAVRADSTPIEFAVSTSGLDRSKAAAAARRPRALLRRAAYRRTVSHSGGTNGY